MSEIRMSEEQERKISALEEVIKGYERDLSEVGKQLAKYEDALGGSDYSITMATGHLDESGDSFDFPETMLLEKGDNHCLYRSDHLIDALEVPQ